MSEDIIKNPCKGIIKTDTAPHNRTLRTDFWRKLKDAFIIFYGAFCRRKLGILDYCALGLPFAMQQLASDLSNALNPWIKYGIGLPVYLLAALLIILKALIAAIIVFNPVSLIVTAAVQFVVWYIAGGKELQEQA